MIEGAGPASDKIYDVAIIGGGINGASAAQHLAAAGYSVLLVEKGDFGSGSTSRSSRLLHCGLRYLAPGKSIFEFVRHPTQFVNALRMAKQAMEARSEIVRTSAARTNTMQLCFPIYEEGPYKSWQVDIAFKLLQALGPKDVPLDYRRISRDESASMPLIRSLSNFDKLKSVALFREYQLNWPERICVDSVLNAERLGADVCNYSSARIISRRENGWLLEIVNQTHPAGIHVNATAVINTAGIWIDAVNRAIDPHVRRRILGTKGCHILVKLPPECADIGIATLNSRREPFYCVPWRGYHYFGPTETLYDGDNDRVVVTPEERAFLLSEANRMLPILKLSEGDVLMSWAGLRPLTYDENQPRGNRVRTIHDLSDEGMPNVFALTAGPVMSYRSAGREWVEILSERIAPAKEQQQPDYSPSNTLDNQNSPPVLDDDTRVKLSDLRQAVRTEHAQTLMDVLYRRVDLGWDCSLTENELKRAAEAVGDELGWDDSQKSCQIATFRADVNSLFGPSGQLRPFLGNTH
jgi:glycerol-3-phosphate dehydrogenase